jgi:RNA 3'-terminal phosphate cyclase (ATP)
VLILDGSHGEGGGQILRTALSLAVLLGRPVSLTRIRANRPKPGLRPQHLTVVRALAAISEAEVAGDALGSTELRFVPHTLRGGGLRFDIGAIRGSAGSVPLLFQALLVPLSFAAGPSRLSLLGGTHVPGGPPVPYLADVYLPTLRRLGVRAEVRLRRWGWYPAGGGELEATIQPAPSLRGLVCDEPADVGRVRGLSAVSRLPGSIAERQRRRAAERLAAAGVSTEIAVEEDATARGPGTLLFLAVPGRAGFTALGRRGVPAERVADEAVDALLHFGACGAAVDDHLADQLVPFLALAEGPSRLTCPTVSSHLRTVIWVVRQFVSVGITVDDERLARLSVSPAGDRV